MDRLSSLSDDVLAHILSFLNIKSAVQTSVLASRWKYLYMFTTGLNIDSSRFKLSSYRNAVSRVLMQHKVNIKKFTLWLPYDCGDVDGSVVKSWIAVAVSRGVEEFNFCIHGKYDWDLGSLFISLTLVVFNLRGCGTGTFPRIPSSVWLPNLKILHMTEIRLLDSSSMTRLFDGCPLLEDLSLDSCVWEDGQVYTIPAPMLRYLNITTCEDMNIYLDTEPKVEFDVPRLKCFEFVGPVRELYCIKNSSALAIAKVVDCSWWDDIFSLVRGLSNATTMKLVQKYYQDSDDKYCSRRCLPDRLPIFGNLLELEVSLGPRNSSSVLTKMLQHLISKSPKLETLVFREVSLVVSLLLPISFFVPSSWVISLGDSLVLLSRPQSRFLSFLRWRSPDGSWLEGFVPDCDSVVVQGCFVHDVGCDCDSRKLLFRGSLSARWWWSVSTWVIPVA
ncbi:hypothetical protein Dimus_012532 [Dionaea muscipula]